MARPVIGFDSKCRVSGSKQGATRMINSVKKPNLPRALEAPFPSSDTATKSNESLSALLLLSRLRSLFCILFSPPSLSLADCRLQFVVHDSLLLVTPGSFSGVNSTSKSLEFI